MRVTPPAMEDNAEMQRPASLVGAGAVAELLSGQLREMMPGTRRDNVPWMQMVLASCMTSVRVR